jgi:hypothetical protein
MHFLQNFWSKVAKWSFSRSQPCRPG